MTIGSGELLAGGALARENEDDVLLSKKRSSNNECSCITSVFRKKTYTGLLTNYFSFTPFQYKLGLIKTFIDRAYKTRYFHEAYTGLPAVHVTENQKVLNCVVLNYSIPVSEE